MKNSVFLGAFAAAGVFAGAVAAGTLDEVRSRGVLKCGVNTGLAGFAVEDGNGNWDGFDVAICRAVAAAVLSDPDAVEYVPTTGKSRFLTLANGDVDMLARNTTWTLTSDAGMGFNFVGISYYDAQGFIVPRELGVTSARELDDVRICIQTDTTSALNLADFFKVHSIEYQLVPIETNSEALDKYTSGVCNVYTTDASGLAASRATFENPGEHTILPETISKEPLGPLVRHGDDQWADVVRWTLNALIAAEELGVTSANVNEMAEGETDNSQVNRMLGTEGNLGEMLGLEPDWAKRAIAAGGNYGELFEKHIGENTPIGLARGLNAQWIDGGLIYAPPFR